MTPRRHSAAAAGRCETRRLRGDRRFLKSGSTSWSVGLTALVGAWFGHFLEYVRVAGWHSGVVETTSSAHAYFLPAGAALVAAVIAVAALVRRAWLLLAARVRSARVDLARAPQRTCREPEDRPTRRLGLAELWAALTVLQLAIWLVQENLEAVGAGHRAPLLSVVTGTHILAPVLQAEVALILAVVYLVVHRRFAGRQQELWTIERAVARRWARAFASAPLPGVAPAVPSTPLERWGAQRWQRPPPLFLHAQ